MCVYVCVMDSPVDCNEWRFNSWIKNVNHWTPNIDDLFVVLKVSVEPATVFS